MDHCQKVFTLPREDCCIAFAESTTIAYPFLRTVSFAVELNVGPKFVLSSRGE